MAERSPSFIEIERRALPCTHCRPASITSHFELSIMIGTRARFWLAGDEIQERPSPPSNRHRLVHVDVDTWAPFSTCWRRRRALLELPFRISRAAA
jgi:hypothetical protein